GDNVVTVATDGFDRYPSVLESLAKRKGLLPPEKTAERFEQIFRGGGKVLDLRPRQEKERLFGYKEEVWRAFGYSAAYLKAMQSQSFWDAEFDRIPAIDEALLRSRRA